MIGQSFLPSAALREYVKSYQLWHFVFPNETQLPFKPYAPRPEQALVFCPRGFESVEHVASKKIVKRPQTYIMGQYTERTNRHLGTADFMTFLVNFQPGALFRITGIPYYERTNASIDAEDIFPKKIRLVNHRLNSTDNYQEMIKIVEWFLLDVVRTAKKDAHALDFVTNSIIEHPENSSILQRAKESFLCPRQFERKFKERMGVNPKLFARIARVNKAFRIKYRAPGDDWLSIALACGYHDYHHLVKDFHDFTGLSPNAYLLEDLNKSPERFFGLQDSSLL
jgi:AraC-like DNA-binding protein